MAVKCKNCGGAHPKWDCSKPPKSTAARKDVRPSAGDNAGTELVIRNTKDKRQASCYRVEGTQAPPVDTLPKPKMGRPRTGYIKAEYNRQYSADKRAADKLGVSVREYRASKACLV